MKNGKRHLILAGLVLALGTAVYLNWQFAPTESFIAPTRTDVSRSDLGRAEFVSAELDATAPARQNSVLTESRLNRQTARDKVLDELEKQLKDTTADSAARSQALEARTQHVNGKGLGHHRDHHLPDGRESCRHHRDAGEIERYCLPKETAVRSLLRKAKEAADGCLKITER